MMSWRHSGFNVFCGSRNRGPALRGATAKIENSLTTKDRDSVKYDLVSDGPKTTYDFETPKKTVGRKSERPSLLCEFPFHKYYNPNIERDLHGGQPSI